MIAFLCNGEKWEHIGEIRKLALDYGFHYYITDSISEVSEVFAKVAEEKIKIICILGGDGTICQWVTPIFRNKNVSPIIGVLGGGTMNNLKEILALKGDPLEIAQKIILAAKKNDLPAKTAPLLKVEHAGDVYFGFMFVLGPIVRLLKKYTDDKRNIVRAFLTACGASCASLFKWPKRYYDLIYSTKARVEIIKGDSFDGSEIINSHKMTGILASTVKRTIFGFYPFLGPTPSKNSDKFYTIISSLVPSEIIKALPYLAYLHFWEKWKIDFTGRFSYEFFNRPCKSLSIETEEKIFTIDGEIFEIKKDLPIKISLGPEVSLYSPSA